ncbi:MAG: ABC transporter permease [Andreesenia angusta]|nr:ABC transporter permease [Andreesenia angusta]
MKDLSTFQQFIYYFEYNGIYVLEQFVKHFLISLYGVLFACIAGIPIGIYISNKRKIRNIIISIANIIQTIPSLAMVSMLIVVLGLGSNTVIFSIFLYSLLPIIKNTVTGIRSVSENLLDAAKGMGMTRGQIITKVQLPLALPVLMAGIRNALVIGIGVTAIGTFVGAGGLGDIISRGVNATEGTAIILAGTIPTAFMTIFSDLFLSWVEKKLNPIKQ